MKQQFQGWKLVAKNLCLLANHENKLKLNKGQAESLRAIANRLSTNGVILADEVGMGKTRVAVAVARAVTAAGGRVAILIPPGLDYQWGNELQAAEIPAPPILRSLWQYLQAWETKETAAPWFSEPLIVVSHAFTNWRLGGNPASWRWALLPEIYAQWRKSEHRRLPHGYWRSKGLDNERVRHTAESIVDGIMGSPNNDPARKFIQELAESTPWPGALAADEYGRNAQLRPLLEQAVGLGLGVFDLVVVDEAHKSRGHDSGLNRLLSGLILQSSDARCLAITATPVELDATQWTQMLARIQVDEDSKAKATTAISNYAEAVVKVRQCPSDQGMRENYKASSGAFQQALSRYLLRRDKREDPAVIKFREVSGEPHYAYRREQAILIDTGGLTTEWKKAVCAAEALSFVTRQSDNSTAKRLRLTLGNGHGIAALIDQTQRDDKDDHKQTVDDVLPVSTEQTNTETETEGATDKRMRRAEWWQSAIIQPFVNGRSALFNHPAILAAVEEIEHVCESGEKVLVFGRFTRPLRALTQLLNAREMLRCLDAHRPWPQSKVHENDNWDAILSAHQQLQRQGTLDRERLNRALQEQYKILENQRSSIREKLISHIEKGLNSKQFAPDKHTRALFNNLKKTALAKSEQGQDDKHVVAVAARAMQELLGENIENATPANFAQAFIDLVAAASDHDEVDGQLDEAKTSDLWSNIRTRLHEEYNRPEGGYARLMYGDTTPATRRFLQLAFNRQQGHPKVLVAQSLVGREGLNLHKACRTVVLLHPEWNPGVVEQQIGRVDRIGSLWENKLNQAVADKRSTSDLPRIEIRPIIFRGTYDEKNWQILNERWDNLRAQLHGIVIAPHIAERYSNAEEWIAEINDAAPNFSPALMTAGAHVRS